MSFGHMAAYLIAGALILVLCGIFLKPLKGFLVMALYSVLGGFCLYISNLLLSLFGFSIGINIVTATVYGLFGLPGFVLLLLLKLLFMFM